jgi:ATP-dependent exoDNAse (exonuclease V) alpha subunit
VIEHDLSQKVRATYPTIIEERMADTKEISASEVLADQYQILEKDIDYGYAITAHKSQGSTYRVIFFDEHNFNQLKDGWSLKHACPINRAMERDQLKYVAMTRPSQMAYIFS